MLATHMGLSGGLPTTHPVAGNGGDVVHSSWKVWIHLLKYHHAHSASLGSAAAHLANFVMVDSDRFTSETKSST